MTTAADDLSPHLFRPLSLRSLIMTNRIVVSPMCQYSAVDGVAQDWHYQHYGSLASSGPAMVMIEATAISAEGRITHGCLGLYSDAAEAAVARIVKTIRSVNDVRIGIQLAHAGRKGSAHVPWAGGKALSPAEKPWPTVSASAVPFDRDWPMPVEAGPYELEHLRVAFADAAVRAERIGIDVVEIHSAHGYLLHQFLSPLSNRRTDVYGGSLDNRMRFPLEIIRVVRRVLPERVAMGIRISATDWVDGGFNLDEAVAYLNAAKAEGLDYVCVSSGGLVADAKIPVGPGYQLDLAARIRRDTGLVTRAVGLITEPHQAERVIAGGQADLVALGRAFLNDPRWSWRAALALGVRPAVPRQYARAHPTATSPMAP